MRLQPVNRKPSPETSIRPWPAFPVGAAIFFVGSFLYVWLRVEPVLEYHHCGPYFYAQRAFMESFLGQPGGLTAYAGVFLAQLNCLNWLGALVFVLSAWAIFLSARLCLVRISGRAPGWATLVPLFGLLVLRNRYGCPVPDLGVGLVLALGAAAAHLSWPWRRPWVSMAVSGVLSALVFFLAGLWSALLFAVLCGLFVSGQMRHWPAGVGCLGLALAAPLVVMGLGKIDWAGLFNPWPDGVNGFLAAALYASVPVVAGVLALLAKHSPIPPAADPGGSARTWRVGQAAAGLAFLAGCAVVGFTFDGRQKLLARIDYAATHGQYEAVLAAASRVKALNDPAKFRVQLALYHTGRLAEELFSFHSLVEETPRGTLSEGCRAQTQPLLELGLVNDAEHMACESLVLDGDRPDVLRLLARIQLLKNRPQAAQVFLNRLSLIPFEGERADGAWPATDAPAPMAERALLARRQAPVLTNDVVHEGMPVARLLDVLLVSDPTNQMAFEYAMAACLLDLDLKQAVEHLRWLGNFPYVRIPRPYEEALLLYQQLTKIPVDLKGRAVRPETIERFRQFKGAVKQYKASAEDLAAMAANFGDTYWYYYYTMLGRERAAEVQTAAP